MPTSLNAVVCGVCVIDPVAVEGANVPFNWTAGTSLAFRLTVQTGAILRFDEVNSAIAALSDDAGANLLTRPDGSGVQVFWQLNGFSGEPQMIVSVSGMNPPSPGATFLTIEARLRAVVGTSQISRTIDAVALQPGWTDPGGLDIRIVEVGVPSPEEGGGEFQFFVKVAVLGEASLRLRSMQFTDDAGNSLSPISSTQTASNGDLLTKHFFPAALQAANIVLELWDPDAVEETTLQARVSFGLSPSEAQ